VRGTIDKLIEAARKQDEAYALWIMTFDILKLEVERMVGEQKAHD